MSKPLKLVLKSLFSCQGETPPASCSCHSLHSKASSRVAERKRSCGLGRWWKSKSANFPQVNSSSTLEKIFWRMWNTLLCCYFFETTKPSVDCWFPLSPPQGIHNGLDSLQALTEQLSNHIGLWTCETMRHGLSPQRQAEGCSGGQLTDQECLYFLLLCFRPWSCSRKPVAPPLNFVCISLFLDVWIKNRIQARFECAEISSLVFIPSLIMILPLLPLLCRGQGCIWVQKLSNSP